MSESGTETIESCADTLRSNQGRSRPGKDNFKKPNSFNRVEYAIGQLSYQLFPMDLPSLDLGEKKFSGRNRIYISNIGTNITMEDLNSLFEPYGETIESYVNHEKNFAFLKMDYFRNALKACRELDGFFYKTRVLRVRLSPSCGVVRVKNLSPYVTNELIYQAFLPFGEIENVVVPVDDKGKSLAEAVIDFKKKGCAQLAIQKCSDKCYFLSHSLKPVIVELEHFVDNNIGYQEKHINRNHPDYQQDRSLGPRLAQTGSFEDEYGTRWKALFDIYKCKEKALCNEFKIECQKLEAQMEFTRHEHEIDSLRTQLVEREQYMAKHRREWELKDRQAQEEQAQAEVNIHRIEEVFQSEMARKQESMKRHQQEANMYAHAQNLTSILMENENIHIETPSSSTRGQNFQPQFKRPQKREAYGGWVNDNVGKNRRFSSKLQRY